MISFTKSFEELQDIFSVHLQKQKPINNYPFQFLETRSQLIQWVIDICQKLHFKNETLHRTILLFDLFISDSQNKIDLENYHNIKLTVIACLSIAAKLNELHYNFFGYFNDRLLNCKKNKYTNQDLANKEIQILQTVNYETNYSNLYHFNAIFTQIVLEKLSSSKEKSDFIKLNEAIVKKYIISDYCVKMSPVNSGIVILNKSLISFENSIDISQIIHSIELLNSNKAKNVDNSGK